MTIMTENNNLFNYLKERVQILSVIGEHVLLKKAGFYWKGRCPFHDEKTGSFTVSPHREIFYCFGCHAGGDVITFISKIENCTPLEAAKSLADRFNISLPQELSLMVSTESADEKKRYFNICQVIAEILHKNLLSYKPATVYLKNRMVTNQSINEFSLGYLPSGQQNIKSFLQELRTHNILAKDLLDIHFLEESKGFFHSSFEKRIVFPIKDHLGRLCGFGGRVFEEGDDRSKYYNSRENSFFQKGSLLFGLDKAKKDIHKLKYAFLVEGYTDVIAMHQYGYTNTIATLGTACTLEHLKQLSYHAEKLYILYDGDSAGHNAMLRLAELCWQTNIDLYTLFLPPKQDPADFLHQGGDLQLLINQAQDIISFFFKEAGTNFGQQSLQQKLERMRKCLSIIKNVQDPFKQEILLQQASSIFNFPTHTLKQELNRLKHKTASLNTLNIKTEMPLESEIITCLLEKNFIYAILSNLELLNRKEVANLINYMPSFIKNIINKLQSIPACDEKTRFMLFFDTLNESEKKSVQQFLVREEEQEAQEFEIVLTQLEKKYWKMITQKTKLLLEEAQKTGDASSINDLVSTFLELKKKLLSRGLI